MPMQKSINDVTHTDKAISLSPLNVSDLIILDVNPGLSLTCRPVSTCRPACAGY